MKPFRDKSAPAPRHPRRRLGANGPAPNGPAWGVVIALALAGCSSAKIGGGTTGGDTGGTPGGPGSGAVGGSGGGSGTASNQPGSTGGNGASGSGGVVGVTPPNPTTSAAGTAAACDGLTSRRVRRLSIREYATVVYDLLGAAAQTATLAALPPEPSVAGFDNQDIALLVSEPFMENISDLAAKLSQAADPTTLAPCATAAGSNACLATFINTFASKAYGRPLTAAEVTAAQAVAATGQDYPTAVRLVIELALQSPSMLYVSELGPVNSVASAQPVLLTPYEIASQLSFLLSGSRPDATLLQVAQTSGFQNVSDIQTQAQRLVPTARGQAALTRFINGWMDQGPMTDISKSAMIYPEYTPALAAAMQQEYDTFVSTQLAGGMGTMASFFKSALKKPMAGSQFFSLPPSA